MNFVTVFRTASGVWTSFRACFIAVAVGFLLSGSPAALAQSIFANLSGTVTDSKGAVISGAKVQVVSEGTKVVHNAVTNGTGFFSLTELPTGSYTVSVESTGFEKWEGTGIVLDSSDDKTLGIHLKVGAETQTVTVSAESDQLDVTDSGAKSMTIDSEELQKLTLVGANAAEVLKILPGFAMSSNGGTNQPAFTGGIIGINASSFAGGTGGLSGGTINGVSGGGLSLNTDGQNSADPGSLGSATPVNANPDMISEMTVQTSNFGADNAKGPVVINTISKAGTAAFHGDVRFNARNSALNAEESDSKFNESEPGSGFSKGQLKGPEHYYYPGFGVGGPIIVPGTNFNKSRTKYQFHESYEYYGQQVSASQLDRAFVPTADMLKGDFSALAGWQDVLPSGNMNSVPTANTSSAGYNIRAKAGCTIDKGVMSAACLSPLGQPLLTVNAPAPTSAVPNAQGFNFVQVQTAGATDWQNVAHLDANFSENTKLYINWSHQSEGSVDPMGLWIGAGDWRVPLAAGEISDNKSDLYTVNAVHIFSPTLTVEARFGFTHMDMPGAAEHPNLVSRSALNYPQKGVFGSPAAPKISNNWSLGSNRAIPTLGDYQLYYHPSFYAEKQTPSTSEDVTKVFKTHTLKAGFFWEYTGQAQDAGGTSFGGVYNYGAWSGTQTGNQYADIMMGLVDDGYSEEAFPKTYWNHASTTGVYVTDHWKLNKRITVDIGLRMDHFGAVTPASPFGAAVFNPKLYASQFAAGVPNAGISWHSLDHSIPMAGFTPDLFKYQPRFGAAIDVYGNGKTVVRGGWGEYTYQNSITQAGGSAGTAEGSVNWSCASGSGCPTWELVDQHINNGNGKTNPCAAGSNCAPTVPQGGIVPINPATLQNGGISAVDASNKDNPQTTTYSLNVDQKLPGKLLFELAYVGSHTDHIQSSVNLDSVPLGAMSIPATVLAAPDCAKYNVKGNSPEVNREAAVQDALCEKDFRPYTNYEGISVQESGQKQQYDAFQVSLQRSSGWAVLNLNYSFSKGLQNNAESAAFKDLGVHEYWGINPGNRGHVVNAIYVFDLPKVNNGNQILRVAADGWRLSGFTTIQEGQQTTGAINGTNASGGQNAVLTGSPDIPEYAQFTCNPKLDLKSHQFLNGNCYSLPTIGSYGSGRTPYTPGPMYWDTDATIVKNFKIAEKQNLELKFAGYNFLNHSLLSFNGGDSNLTLNGNVTDTKHTCPGPYCAAFGFADYHYGHRVVEMAAKFNF